MNGTDYYAVAVITGLMALIVLAIWANLRDAGPR